MNCFKCKLPFDEIKLYLAHLKNSHLMRNVDFYKCSVIDCQKTFTQRKHFIKHLNNSHKNKNDSISENTRTDLSNESGLGGVECIVNMENDENTEISEVFVEKNDENDLEKILMKNLMVFLNKLHSNSSLTKQIIATIYDDIKVDIINPITSISSISSEDKEGILRAFESLDSYHKFTKNLGNHNMQISSEKLLYKSLKFKINF